MAEKYLTYKTININFEYIFQKINLWQYYNLTRSLIRVVSFW